MVRRFFQRLEQRIRRMFTGTVRLVDQENTPRPVQRFIRRPLLEQTHLRNAQLPQRTVRRKGQKIRMRTKKQRIFIPFISRKFFAPVDQADVLRQAQVVAFNLLGRAQQPRRETSDQSRLAQTFQPGKQHGLRDTPVRNHPFERGLDV